MEDNLDGLTERQFLRWELFKLEARERFRERFKNACNEAIREGEALNATTKELLENIKRQE